MSNTPVIVDAVKTESTSGASCSTQNIPVKINTSQMQQALQTLMSNQVASAAVQTEAPAVDKVNPSVYVQKISETMSDLYGRFEKLKKLASELHGKQLDSPLPDHVTIKNISIEFLLRKNGVEEAHTADIKNVSSVGDITNLMSAEFGLIILALTEQAKQLEDIAHKTGEKCDSALKEWEKANKDKRIVRTDGAGNVAGLSADETEMSSSDAPVTLEAS